MVLRCVDYLENKKPPEAPSGGLMQEASRARRISVLCRFDYY